MKAIKLLLLLLFISPLALQSQRRKNKVTEPTIKLEDSLFQGIKWRNIGPFRGGRSVASTGVVDQPMTVLHGTIFLTDS